MMYNPNLGLLITLFVREREPGCFGGSTKGAKWHKRGALKERGETQKEQRLHCGSMGEALKEQVLVPSGAHHI